MYHGCVSDNYHLYYDRNQVLVDTNQSNNVNIKLKLVSTQAMMICLSVDSFCCSVDWFVVLFVLIEFLCFLVFVFSPSPPARLRSHVARGAEHVSAQLRGCGGRRPVGRNTADGAGAR